MRDFAVLVNTPFFTPNFAKSISPRPTRVPPLRSRFPETALIASWIQKASDPWGPMLTPVEQ
jgi:hypothetical protein